MRYMGINIMLSTNIREKRISNSAGIYIWAYLNSRFRCRYKTSQKWPKIAKIAKFTNFKVAKLMKWSKKVQLNQNIEFRRCFIHNFHQQEKFWNHLLNSTLRMARQKSFHHVYLSRPGRENLHIKAGKKSSCLVFYPIPSLIKTAPKKVPKKVCLFYWDYMINYK